MKKFWLSLTGLILIAVAGLYFAPNFINWNQHKSTVITQISNITGRQVTIDGDIKITFLPLPKFSVGKVTLSNIPDAKNVQMITAGSANGGFSFIDALSGKLNITNMTLDNAVINLETLGNGQNNWEFLYKLSKQGNIQLDTINFENSKINMFFADTDIRTLSGLSAQINIANNKLDLNGNLIDQNGNIGFAANHDFTTKKVSWSLNTDTIDSQFDGAIELDQTGHWYFTGKLDSTINDHRFFSGYIAKIFPNFADMPGSKLENPIKITGNIKLSEKKLSSDKIALDSDDIAGEGSFGVALADKPNFLLDLTLGKLNLDAIVNLEEIAQANNSVDDYIAFNPKNFSDFDIKLKAENITFNKQNFKSFGINTKFSDDNLVAKDIALVSAEGSQLLIPNALSRVIADTNVLIGELEITGKKLKDELAKLISEDVFYIDSNSPYKITSKILLSPKELSLIDFNLKSGDENISGVLARKILSNKTSHLIDLRFDNYNLDNIKTPQFAGFLSGVFTDSYKQDYLNNFTYLRKIIDDYTFNIALRNVTFKNKNIISLDSKIDISDAKVDINITNLLSDIADLNAKIFLEAQALIPKLNMDISGNNLDLDEMIVDFIPSYKVNHPNEPKANPVPLSQWSYKYFDFFRLDNYLGDVKLDLKKFKVRNFEFADMNLALRINNRNIYIDDLKGKFLGGDLSGKGSYNYSGDGPSISFAFNLNNSDLGKILSPFTDSDSIRGPTSIAGTIITRGNSPLEWSQNLGASISMVSRDITMNGMDLSKAIKIANKPASQDKLTVFDDMQSALLVGSSKLKTLDGTLSIKDGLAKTNNFTFTANKSVVGVVSAAIDVPQWLVNLQSRVTFKPQGMAENVTVDYSLQGTLNKIKRTIKANDMNSYLAKTYNVSKKNAKTLESTKNINEQFNKDSKYIFESLKKEKVTTNDTNQ